MRLKILQWNIWFQEKVENIIEFIKEVNPDILCLQELTRGSKLNNFKDVPKIISKELNFECNFALTHKFEDNHVQGNAIFSRFPIVSNSNFLIVEPKESHDFSSEGRICAVSKIQLGNKIVTIATTHGSYNPRFIENEVKLIEVEKLLVFFSKFNEKLIFTGDLNITSNTKYIKLIEERLFHCGPDYKEPTWTTKPFSYQGFEETKLKWRLDYTFATRDVKVISSKIVKTKFSDHLPILLEVEI